MDVKKRARYQKKVLHPLFQKSSEYTLNPFWSALLNKCSIDIFPKGISYQDGKIIMRKKNIQRQFSLPSSPEMVCKTMINIFKTELGIVSSMEDKKQTEFVESEKEIIVPNCLLSNIKDKNVKYRLLFDFTSNFKHHFGISESERKRLLSLIYVGMLLKIILPENIQIENYKILNIEHIHFKDGKFILDLEYAKESSSRKSCRKI